MDFQELFYEAQVVMALHDAPLGQSSEYPKRYAPELLFPVPRYDNRRRLGLDDGRWPWFGADIWQAWELSWIQPGGVPAVAWGIFKVPAASPCIIESKSLKLYLNSLNQEIFSNPEQVVERLEKDLSSASDGVVSVQLFSVDEGVQLHGRPQGATLIDHVSSEIDDRQTPAEMLIASGSQVSECLCSHLLKSNCPVTGQPDWATLVVDYTGPSIDRAGLLHYVVSYRQQEDFHEHCVESVFADILKYCQPEKLTVSAHYTRRGGLDISPWRSTESNESTEVRKRPHIRLVRQ